jgi:hypothetical protein
LKAFQPNSLLYTKSRAKVLCRKRDIFLIFFKPDEIFYVGLCNDARLAYDIKTFGDFIPEKHAIKLLKDIYNKKASII